MTYHQFLINGFTGTSYHIRNCLLLILVDVGTALEVMRANAYNLKNLDGVANNNKTGTL